MEIVERDIESLIPYVNNTRTHSDEQVAQICASVREYGWTNPVLIDEEGTIIAGHGRVLAAKRLGMGKVPCIVLPGLTKAQKKAYSIADNKMALNAGWDDEKLRLELESLKELDFDLSLTGFGQEEVDSLLGDEREIDSTEDGYDELPPAEPRSKPGERYRLGEHILMCGDSTSQSDVDTLMEGEEADLVVTDPPYNVNISSTNGLTIENDNVGDGEFQDFLDKAFGCMASVLKAGGAYYVWYAFWNHVPFESALRKAPLPPRQQLIWAKGHFALGVQDYQWKHEPCFYGWKEGASHYFIDDRTQSTVIEDGVPDTRKMTKEELRNLVDELLSDRVATTVLKEKKPLVADLHPTMKPVRLFARLVANSSRKGEKVLDLFGGSGTTLIACEQLGRKCYMMEYDPRYVDVIIDRWEKFTGRKAERIE